MRFEARPVRLRPETRELFERLRGVAVPLSVFGLDPEAGAALARDIGGQMFDGAELPPARVLQYRWFVGELVRVLRTRTGPALVFQLELVLRKWVAFGLAPKAAQFLLRAVVERLEAEAEPEPRADALAD